MPATRTIQLGARSITVRELTVADVRELLITSPRQADPLHALAFDDFGLRHFDFKWRPILNALALLLHKLFPF